MGKIDINDWGEFTVEELFNIRPTKSYKLANAELLDCGESPVVVNSAYNNGIGGTSSKAITENGNMITFSDTVDANTIFYQENPFIGYSHVQGLYPIGSYINCWSKESLMFFATSFRKSALAIGFDYGNKFRRDIAQKIKVKLPIDSQGNPDWIYMENHMQEIEKRVQKSLLKLDLANNIEQKKLDISTWGEFRLGDYFEVKYGKFRPKSKLGIGTINYVTASGFNNGITETIDIADYEGNCITVASDGAMGSAFYQEKPFSTSNIVSTLIPLKIIPLNKYIAQFICVLIFSKKSEFGWSGYKFSVDRVRSLIIKLPIDSNGTPDWGYMENYMKEIEKKAKVFLDKVK